MRESVGFVDRSEIDGTRVAYSIGVCVINTLGTG